MSPNPCSLWPCFLFSALNQSPRVLASALFVLSLAAAPDESASYRSSSVWASESELLLSSAATPDRPPVLLGTSNQGSEPGTMAGAEPEYVPDAILVAFHKNLSRGEKRQTILAASGFLFLDDTVNSPYFDRIKISEQGIASGLTVMRVVEQLRADPRVRIAEPDYLVRLARTPNDPEFVNQYALHNTGTFQGKSVNDADIDAPEAWDLTTGSSSVIVAVTDTGVDYNHPDLAANILRDASNNVVGYDYANNDPDPMDDMGHGTYVAGIIGAVGNNGIGSAGVCWNVRIMPLKIFNPSNTAPLSASMQGIDFAIEHGAHVINASWGGYPGSDLLLEAIKRAEAAGVAFVAAAMNWAWNNDIHGVWPANYNAQASNVISVAACDWNDQLASYSDYGPASVDIIAPGDKVLSTYPGNKYASLGGTSAAAPHVAGAYALLKSKFPNATMEQIKARILYSSERVENLSGYARWGRLNLFAAMESDSTVPSSPLSLMVTHNAVNSVRLSWTAAGDDGTTGTVSAYELLYDTDSAFSHPRIHTAVMSPGAPGTQESYVLSGLLPDTPYYIALRAIDNVGNKSANVTVGPVRTRNACFYDNAEGTPQFIPTTGSTWAIVTKDSFSGKKCYTDSPGSKYPSGEFYNSLVQKEAITVRKPMLLRFRAKTDLDSNYIYAGLLVSFLLDGDTSWRLLGTISGKSDWTEYIYIFNDYFNRQLKIHFMVSSHEGGTPGDGVWLDDIQFVQLDPAFLDDAEGEAKFKGLSPWAITTEKSMSSSHAYSDSPSGKYKNNAFLPLVSNRATPLELYDSCLFTFNELHDLESDRDYLYVYASRNDGAYWEYFDSLTGTTSAWKKHTYPLKPSRDVQVVFLLTTNEAVARDGIYLDDIQILGDPLVPLISTPGKTTLVSPSGTISTAKPTYVWNAVASATWYQLWVSDSANAGGKIKTWYTAAQAGCASGSGTCSVTPDTALSPGAAKWWILTYNDAGNGPWSDSLTFSVPAGGTPGKATLLSPSGNIQTGAPTYTWNAVSSSTWYQLWVNDSATSQAKINLWYMTEQAGCASGTGTCSVRPAISLPAGSYQWWIQTWNDSGDGPWSNGLLFSVAAAGQ